MKRITVLLVCAFLSILIIGTSCQKTLDNSIDILNGINGIKNQNDSLLRLTIQLQKSLDSMRNQVNQNSTILNSINSRVIGLQNSVDTLLSNIKQVGLKIDTTNNNILLLQVQVNTLSKQYLSLSTQISSVFAMISLKIDSLSIQIGSNSTVLNTIQEEYLVTQIKVDSILLAIQNYNQQLSTANTNIASIQQQLILLTTQYNDVINLLNQLIGLINTQSSLSNLSNGLIAFYPFNGNANDESGNSNNGVVNGATLTTDRFGNTNSAYLFTGNPQNITIPNLHQTNILTYTVSGWFQLTQNSVGTIISGDEPLVHPSGLRFELGTNQAQWDVEDGWNANGILTYNNNNFGNNIWHNFTVTFNSIVGLIPASAFQIYIDGVTIPTLTFQQNWPPGSGYSEGFNVYAPVNNGTLPIILGNTMDGSSNFTNFFPGKLDDIRIYNRVLTQSEITYLATH